MRREGVESPMFAGAVWKVIDDLEDKADVQDDERVVRYRRLQTDMESCRNRSDMVNALRNADLTYEDLLWLFSTWLDAFVEYFTGKPILETSRGPVNPWIKSAQEKLTIPIHKPFITFLMSKGVVSTDKAILDLLETGSLDAYRLAEELAREYPIGLITACRIGRVDLCPEFRESRWSVDISKSRLHILMRSVEAICKYASLPGPRVESASTLLRIIYDRDDDLIDYEPIPEPGLETAMCHAVRHRRKDLLTCLFAEEYALANVWAVAEQTGQCELFSMFLEDFENNELDELAEFVDDLIRASASQAVRCVLQRLGELVYDYSNGKEYWIQLACETRNLEMVQMLASEFHIYPNAEHLVNTESMELIRWMVESKRPDNGSSYGKCFAEACLQERWPLATELLGHVERLSDALAIVLRESECIEPLNWLLTCDPVKDLLKYPDGQMEVFALNPGFQNALECGFEDLVRWYLTLHPYRAESGSSVLHAVRADRPKIVKLLFEFGAPIEYFPHSIIRAEAFPNDCARDPYYFTGILEWAIRKEYSDLVEILRPRTDLGIILRSVLSAGLIRTAEQLLNMGASPRSVGQLTVSHNLHEVRSFLKQHGASTRRVQPAKKNK